MPFFILAGGELVLLFLGARIAWWILRTRAGDSASAAGGPPPGSALARRTRRRRRVARSGAPGLRPGILRDAA
jgi:hypothetical protein